MRSPVVALGLALALVFAVVVAAVPAPADLVGKSTSGLRLLDLSGRPVDLSAEDVLYLVDSWAPGCTPCLWELPDLARLERELVSEPRVRFVSVIGGVAPKSLLRMQRRYDIAIHADPDQTLEDLGCRGFPTKLLVRNGRVIDAKMGATPDRNYDRIVAWLRRWEPGFVPSAAPAPAPSGKVAAADPDGRVTVRGRVCAGDEADIEDAAATCETPIAGATLVLRNGEREEVSATSGPDGRFALPPIRLTHGWNRFLVSAGGYSGLSSADLPGDPLFGGPGGGEEEITIRLPASTGHSP